MLTAGAVVVARAALRPIRAKALTPGAWVALRFATAAVQTVLAVTFLAIAFLLITVATVIAVLELLAVTARAAAAMVFAAVALVVTALGKAHVVGIAAHAMAGKVAVVAVSVAHGVLLAVNGNIKN